MWHSVKELFLYIQLSNEKNKNTKAGNFCLPHLAARVITQTPQQ